MKQAIARKSREQGLAHSRLPEFTEEEKMMNIGESAYLMLIFYSFYLWDEGKSPFLI
jgi:hypothetical protein